MRITLFKNLGSYYFHTNDIRDVPGAVIYGDLIYVDNVPVGRIATEKDIERELIDNKLEFGEI